MKENGKKCPSEEKARKKRDDFLKLYNIYKSGSKLFCESCLCRDLCVCAAHPVVGRRKKREKKKKVPYNPINRHGAPILELGDALRGEIIIFNACCVENTDFVV